MGRRPKQIFLQRRHLDGQKAHEEMFNIANRQRNENQNYNEVSPHTSKWSSSKNPQTTNAIQGVERREPSYPVGGKVNWYNHHVEQCGCSFSSVQFSCSVVSDSLQPHELQHARPPCPSPTPRVHSDSHPLSQ